MKTVIIGSGNMATHLGRALFDNGFEIIQVISPNEKHAKKLAARFHCNYSTEIKQAEKATLYLIAIPDKAIADAAKELGKAVALHTFRKNEKPLVLHTAAAVSLKTIENNKWQSGVLYPLQSLKKETDTDLKEVPLIISGKADKIKKIAAAISRRVTFMGDEQRLALHVSAVFVNNFTNHLVAIAQEICQQHHIDFKLLQPLLKETFERLEKMSAAESQTGPAIRGDKNTLKKHIEFISTPTYKAIYKDLTKSIQQSSQ